MTRRVPLVQRVLSEVIPVQGFSQMTTTRGAQLAYAQRQGWPPIAEVGIMERAAVPESEMGHFGTVGELEEFWEGIW